MRKLTWLALATLVASCASTAPPPVAAPLPAVPSAEHVDADAYRKALEEAYATIVARATTTKPQSVDVDAVASMAIPSHRTVGSALKYFTTELKPSIQTSLTRSAQYRKLIDKALDEYKLPHGLAYLPVIESAYIPTMTSRSGAHGIWQFMPETAREYGLRVDWWVDERADPERSTRAAAAYLKDLYRQFNDWPLTLAAYNAGPGRIRRALESTGSSTFWELLEQSAISKETRGYVPTFYATLIIASDPATYGFSLNDPIDWNTKRVDIEGPVSLQFLAEVSGTDESLLRDLNPSLRRGIVPPGRTGVRIPAKSADLVAARATTLRNDDPVVGVTTFTLRGGDTLPKLAKKLGTSPDTILAMNGIGRDQFRAGESVYLPVRARDLGALLTRGSGDDRWYAVAKGDTLYSIAKRHNLSVEELVDLNSLGDDHTLQPGEKLRVRSDRSTTAGGM